MKKKLLKRLDQAILDGIDNPEKTQQTTAIGTLFWQTLYIDPRSLQIWRSEVKYNHLTLFWFWIFGFGSAVWP